MKLFNVNNKSMTILNDLKAALANLSDLAAEKSELEQRRAKAQSEIAALGQEKITPQMEAKVGRLSATIAVCDTRLAHLESNAQSEADAVKAIYLTARETWNKRCKVRREMARASFLTSCLPHFDHDEAVTAERLSGIMPLPLVRAARAGWNLCSGPRQTAFEFLREVETFIGHVERHSSQSGIPIE